jgi:hypothetical protein
MIGSLVNWKGFEMIGPYSLPDIIRMISSRKRWEENVARMKYKGNACRVLVGKLEGKRPLETPRRGWEDNIKMDLREIGWGGMDWIDVAQGREQF